MMKFQLSSVTSRKFIGLLTPALLNLTSSDPNSETQRAIISLTLARSVMSTRTPNALPPCPARSLAASATSTTLSLRSA